MAAVASISNMSLVNPRFTVVQVKGLDKIIMKLSNEAIFQLANSVTKKAIQTSSVKEAFNAIISLSDSPEQLLSRKKISRNLLVEYAFNENLSISALTDKKDIIRRILEYWNDVVYQDSYERTNLGAFIYTFNIAIPSKPPALHADFFIDVFVLPSQCDVHYVLTYARPEQQNSCELTLPSQQTNKVNTSVNSGDLSAFGQTFATWFYKMLNAHNEQTKSSDALDFGPQHFWPDSILQANTITDTSVMGAERIAERLLQFTQEGFYFHANIPDGVHTKTESHGLICVLVHGTVHKQQICLGPFEQAFMLLQDPLHGNNWKIKKIWLNVNGSSKASESHSIMPD